MKKFSVFLFFAFIVVLFGSHLGDRPFANPDEARYVRIPYEMLTSHDWLTPRLNGIKYFEKPPLFYWMQGLALKIGGLKEGVMRFWPACMAIMGILATFLFAKRYKNERSGLIAASILTTSPLYFGMGHLITLDMPITFFVTVALFSFYHAFQTPPSLKRRFWFYVFSISCALGVLTKGIMALAIPGPVIFLWLTLYGNWKNLRPFYGATCILLFLAVAAPWHILVSLKNPEFAHKYFIVEHILRYTTTVHMRYQPAWFFIPIFLIGFLPWSFFLPKIVRNFERKNPLQGFLALWIGWVFLFFSISNSKLIPYILPLFPPMALLAAFHIRRISWRPLFGLFVLIYTARIFFGGGYLRIPFLNSFKFLAHKDLFITLYLLSYLIGAILVATILVTFINIYQGNNLPYKKISNFLGHFPLQALILSALFLNLTIKDSADLFQKTSTKPFAEYILKNGAPGEKIACFWTYFQDLPVYLKRRVMVVDYLGELEFGTTVEDTSSWIVTWKKFEPLWNSKQPLWVVGRREEVLKRLPKAKIKMEKEELVLARNF